jgi:hypothetical protein
MGEGKVHRNRHTPKPRPTYKKAATASTDANIGNGEAAAVAALVSLCQPGPAFDHTVHTYQQLEITDEEDLKEQSEDEDNKDEEEEDQELEDKEDQVDQLMESDNEDNGKSHIHVIDILLTAHITRSP